LYLVNNSRFREPKSLIIRLFDQLLVGADDFGFRAGFQFEALIGLVFKVFDGLIHHRQLAIITGFIAIPCLLIGFQGLINLRIKQGLPGRLGGIRTPGKKPGKQDGD